MEHSQPPNGNEVRKTAKEVGKMGLLLLAIGLVVCATGFAAWHQTPRPHYLFMAAFGLILCASGVYTWKHGKRKD
ncbi:MAG: hypothetical protein K9M54_11335 [Kiritimatiellales bacterium]|nr:hypothetical protein [Kiritimatiellales bacterium]MCF7864568.1 hypothetical protein [Kiritimatiellales bacterium]